MDEFENRLQPFRFCKRLQTGKFVFIHSLVFSYYDECFVCVCDINLIQY
jgi:hypothetical protein